MQRAGCGLEREENVMIARVMFCCCCCLMTNDDCTIVLWIHRVNNNVSEIVVFFASTAMTNITMFKDIFECADDVLKAKRLQKFNSIDYVRISKRCNPQNPLLSVLRMRTLFHDYCLFENSNVLFFVILITPLPEEMWGRSIAYPIVPELQKK